MSTTRQRLREDLTRLMQDRQVPGLQAVVLQSGTVVATEALGLANIEHEVPVTQESVFAINSLAKAFTGVALMQLVEAGELDLAAPLSRYLDDLPQAWRQITIHQLATLTSGLPEIMVYGADGSVRLVAASEEAAWEVLREAPMQFEPGHGYSYVQTNYALLGKVIDRISDMPFVDFITQHQFAVAAMTHTRYADDHDVIPHRADTYISPNMQGQSTEGIVRSHLNWPPVLRTAAGLHSTAQDLAAWMAALETDALLTPASRETLWTPSLKADGTDGLWGIGWPVFARSEGMVAAPGGAGKAQVVRYPDGLTLIVLTNLLGAFPEQVAVAQGRPADLTFMDELVLHWPR